MLGRFIGYYRPHRRLFLLDFGCAVISGLLELGFPLAVSAFVDRLLPGRDWGLIAAAAAGLTTLYLLNTGLMVIVTYWGHRLGITIETEMRRRAFDHLQRLSYSFYDEQKTGRLIARVTKDLEDIGEVGHHGPEDLFIAVMTFLGAFALMYALNARLALVTTLVVPPILFVATRYGSRMTNNFRAIFAGIGVFNARLEENIGGMRVVQAFANEAHERALFARDNESYRRVKLQGYRLMAASSALSYLAMRATQVIVMVAGSWFVVHGALSSGDFVGFLLLVGVMFRPVDKISAVLEVYPKGIAGFRRYCELIDTTPTLIDRPEARPAPPLRGEIAYEGVSFGYAPGRLVLRDMDLRIAAGETVAFVGPSGAGKTTICALLPRFYDLCGGRITIDGIDLRDMTLASLRRQIGVVAQDVFLLGLSGAYRRLHDAQFGA
jgi:ATP-binding cassette subfamily B protein